MSEFAKREDVVIEKFADDYDHIIINHPNGMIHFFKSPDEERDVVFSRIYDDNHGKNCPYCGGSMEGEFAPNFSHDECLPSQFGYRELIEVLETALFGGFEIKVEVPVTFVATIVIENGTNYLTPTKCGYSLDNHCTYEADVSTTPAEGCDEDHIPTEYELK